MDSVSSPCLRLTGNWAQACILLNSQYAQLAWRAMAPNCNGSCRVQALKTLCETWLEKLYTVSQMQNAIKPYTVTREQVLHSFLLCVLVFAKIPPCIAGCKH